jgi:hypothetical protein
MKLRTSSTSRKQDSGMTDEKFERQLKTQNLTRKLCVKKRRRIWRFRSFEEKYAGKITISDREVEDFYVANQTFFVN